MGGVVLHSDDTSVQRLPLPIRVQFALFTDAPRTSCVGEFKIFIILVNSLSQIEATHSSNRFNQLLRTRRTSKIIFLKFSFGKCVRLSVAKNYFNSLHEIHFKIHKNIVTCQTQTHYIS